MVPDITDLNVIFHPGTEERRIHICSPFKGLPADLDPEVAYVTPEGYLVAEDHQSVGLLLHEFSKLEGSIGFLFATFLEAPIGKSAIITDYVSGKSLSDLLRNLGSFCLSDAKQLELVNLVERLSSAYSKRNKIVHGSWMIETSVYIDRKKQVAYKNRVYRHYPCSSKKDRMALSNPREQRIRVNHYFDSRRIYGVMSQVSKLNEDFQSFLKSFEEQPVK
jgi:hypothetical protein